MSTDGARHDPPPPPRTVSLGKSAVPVPRPTDQPPAHPPGADSAAAEPAPPLAGWLHTPRPLTGPGVWRFGHQPKPPEDEAPISTHELYGGALLALLGACMVWSLCWNSGPGSLFRYWYEPMHWITTPGWAGTPLHSTVTYVYYVLFALLLAVVFGRFGKWPRLWRRHRPMVLRLLRRRLDAPPLPARPFRRAAAALIGGALAFGLSFGSVWLFWLEPLYAVVPDSWREGGDPAAYVISYNLYYLLWTALLVAAAAVAGDWRGVWRHFDPGTLPGGTSGADLSRWQQLRDAGSEPAAERLTAELRGGRLSDVDYARINHVWQTVRARPTELEQFSGTVLSDGGAAFTHPSGDRDLQVRTASHDLLTRQVLIGVAVDDDRNPYQHRGTSMALDPTVLGTSLLAVGPPGAGKTGRVVRPVAEALCLHALTGQAAVVAVGDASVSLGPDSAFDVIIRIGDPASRHLLDLYGGAAGSDEAAALVAEALVGDTRVEPREAAAALVQLIGPYRAAYGHFPGVPELRALLDGAPAMLATLGEDLDHAGAWDQQRELAARARAAKRPGDPGQLLADRLAVLDRAGMGHDRTVREARQVRPFSLDALNHPIRLRIDLPSEEHAEARRIISRLVLAQFASAVNRRADRSLFAGLLLDDATAAVTPGTVRGLTQLRAANAGAVLALRTLDDVPQELRPGLLGAVGCRMAFSGITIWDGEHFARAWGKDWAEDRQVTATPDSSGGILRRSARGIRKLFTGRAATTETVTVSTVERERWSSSELAHRLPQRHAVISLTTTAGESGPPVLVRLGR